MDSRSYQPITNGEPQITELIKPAKVDEKMNRLCLLIERKVVQSQAADIGSPEEQNELSLH